MTDDQLLHLLALQGTPKIGDTLAKRLLSHCGSAEAVFAERTSKLQHIEGIGSVVTQELTDARLFNAAENELRYIRDNNIRYHFFTDPDYPERLKHCIDGPILLFSSGKVDVNGKKVISVVGTRNITTYGIDFCEAFIEQLAPLDPVIISGFAYGADITAQRAAAKHGLQTIGCLAHGLNQVYPKAHKRFVPQIEEQGGFITDFWSSSNPDRVNFLKRNRIIAGASEATVVIESAEKGGSLVTASMANSYNREVFAVPGRARDIYSVGCNNLIKTQQAHLLSSAADLIYMLGWEVENTPRGIQKKLFVELNETEKKIFDYLKVREKELLDIIALECELPVNRVSTSLLTMELKGVIRPLPGKLFEVV